MTRQLGLTLFLGLLVGCAQPAPEPLPEPSDLASLEAPVRRQFEQAHELLERLRSDPETQPARLARAFAAVGEIHLAYDHLETARQAFEAAVALEPTEPRWSYLSAHTHYQLGENEAARARYRAVLELQPNHVPTFVSLASLAQQEGKGPRAEELLGRARELDPGSSRVLADLASLALEGDQPEVAVSYLQEALIHQPGASQLHYLLAMAYRGLGDANRSTEHLAKVRATSTQQVSLVLEDAWLARVRSHRVGARVHDQRAQRALAAGRLEVAELELRQALLANPERHYAHYGLAGVLFRLGRSEEALQELDTLLNHDPRHTPSLVLLARIQLALGQTAAARASYHRAQIVGPDDPEVQELRKLLEQRAGLETETEPAATPPEAPPGAGTL